MKDLLRSKGIYRITLGIETAPNDEEKIAKWDWKNDQACGIIGMSISPDVIFNLDGLDSFVKSWDKLNIIFGIKNEIESFQLENKLLIFDPSNFPSIEYYLSKFKTLNLLLESCKVAKEEEPLIYGILANLPLIYSVFVSTFHSTRKSLISTRTKYRSPSLDVFYDSIIGEHEKLLHLCLVKTGNSSNKSLVS